MGIFNSESSARMAQFAHMGMRLYFVGYFFAGFKHRGGGLPERDQPPGGSLRHLHLPRHGGHRGLLAGAEPLVGMNGVWAAFPASNCYTAVLTLFLLLRG